MSSSPNDTSRPIEPDSARVLRISRPTLPVAPTTATLKPISGTPGLECQLGPRLAADLRCRPVLYKPPPPRRAVRPDEIRRILAALSRSACRSPHPRVALSRHIGRL